MTKVPPHSRRHPWGALAAVLLVFTLTGGRLAAAEAPSPSPSPTKADADGAAADEEEPPPIEELSLETSDGVAIAAWYYAVAEDSKPRATVILVHDLEGSHKTVEPFAKALQQMGYAVVTPDLRGHGSSTTRTIPGDRKESLDAKALRKPDLLAIAAATGGRVREQAAARGDLEAVRGWIKRKSAAGELDIDKLCVVGCGSGGMLAALWTVADHAWPPTTSGEQGRQVRALVLISPAWVVKGASIQPAIQSEVLRRTLPILIVSGKNDRDAGRLIDQFKGFRPKEWFIQQPGKKPETPTDLKNPTDATVFCVQLDSTLSADKLASDRSAKAAGVVGTFLALAVERKR